MKETICAISTPPGLGAIALIRLSGPEAFDTAAKLFGGKFQFEQLKPQVAKFSEIYDGEQLIDQVVVTKFAAPRSYTGEDMVEISCHGSAYIQKKIVELLLQNGCRMAEPGEFTMRAFMNGKMDLPQAEAVSDLIDSQSETAHKLAVNQLRGGISNKLAELRRQLVDLASLLELELDFSEEEVEFADRARLCGLLADIKEEVVRLLKSYKLGNNLKNGIPVAIVGRPNVGKSTLLNCLLDEERAIVSDIPGTTRDTVEDTLTLDGVTFRFIDTAGLRAADDVVEQFGIERSLKAMEKAEIVLYLFDVNEPETDVVAEIETLKKQIDLNEKTLLVVGNKDDAGAYSQSENPIAGLASLSISAKKKLNVEALCESLLQTVRKEQMYDGALLTNARHYDCMLRLRDAIELIENNLAAGLPTDLIAIDVHAALDALGTITGTVSNNEILNNIFGRFCIGK